MHYSYSFVVSGILYLHTHSSVGELMIDAPVKYYIWQNGKRLRVRWQGWTILALRLEKGCRWVFELNDRPLHFPNWCVDDETEFCGWKMYRLHFPQNLNWALVHQCFFFYHLKLAIVLHCIFNTILWAILFFLQVNISSLTNWVLWLLSKMSCYLI